MHVIPLALTFAGLQTFKPPVLHVSIAGSSADLVPSTTGSAATDSTGFLERAALWARHHIIDRGSDGWRADWGAGYELSFRD